MTSFVIKIIACFTMILDHIKYAIPSTNNFITVYLGRLAFPLFAFLISEGFTHTSDLKKYYKRLLIFGVISQIPFMLFRTLVGEWKLLNIMFTLLLGLICITIYEKESRKWISIPAIIAIVILGELINVDYRWFGVLTVFLIHLLKNKKLLLVILYFPITFIFYYTLIGNAIFKLEYLLYVICTVLSLIFVILYNGKQGKKMKNFFYWFYPIHMLIVYGLSFIF